jgi:type IV fimbrial biogenesis protein FimT
MPRRTVHGLTLIEVLVAIAIVAVLVRLAAPSFTESIARGRLEGTVVTLANDLHYARSEALRRRSNVTLAVGNDAAGNFYRITDPAAPVGQTELKKVYLADGVTLSGVAADESLTAAAPVVFEGLRGTTPAVTLVGISTQTAARLRVTANALGRLSVCTTSSNMGSYPTC